MAAKKNVFQWIAQAVKDLVEWVEETFADPALSAEILQDLGLDPSNPATPALPADDPRRQKIDEFLAKEDVDELALAATVAQIAELAQTVMVFADSVKKDGVTAQDVFWLIFKVWVADSLRVRNPSAYAVCVLGGMILSSIGFIILGIGQNSMMWALGMFISMLILPITNGSNQAIWQAKVPPDIQGRVFAVRRMIAQITVPVAMLLAGPLADNIFEPGMRSAGSGAMASTFGPLVGVGPGAGMGLMVVISAVLGGFVGLAGYSFRAVRDAEIILPDHDSDGAPEQPAPAPLGELQAAEA